MKSAELSLRKMPNAMDTAAEPTRICRVVSSNASHRCDRNERTDLSGSRFSP